LAIDTVKFAIIGCGGIAAAHADCIEELEETELLAVFDINEEKGRAFADKYGAVYYSSYEELLANPRIEVVNICTPSGLHPNQTIMAAQAGKHIICEKPIATQLHDAWRMIAACHEHGVKLSTVFPRRLAPAAQYLKQFIADGCLGKLMLCDVTMKIHRNSQYFASSGKGTWAMDGGGALMIQGIHMIDLLQWFVGKVASVYGKTENKRHQIEVEDTATALLSFENGTTGLLEMSIAVDPSQEQRIEIHGEKGTAIYTEDHITLLHVDGEIAEMPSFEPFQAVPDGHRGQIQDMALAIREGRSPAVTGEDSVHALEIILGIYQSSRLKQEIRLASLK